jgi:tetratricopeptide (TPR) repeat protein
MPNIQRIFLAKLLIFFITFVQSINCQADTNRLELADSLFNSQNYKEALAIYENLYFEDESYSPAMLLKMAFISEGLGDYPKTTLFLSKYYEHNPNPRVTNKIKALTEQPALIGYQISDREQFFKILSDHRAEITSLLALFLIISLILLFRHRENLRPALFIPSLVLILLVFMANNFLHGPQTAIITGSPTLIMDRPTAGGNLITKVDLGHRVKVNSSKDTWYEIEWANRKAYVKKQNVTKL